MTSPDGLELQLREALAKSPHDLDSIVRYANFCLDTGLWSMANALCRRAEQYAPHAGATVDLRARVDAVMPSLPATARDLEAEAEQRLWAHPALRWLRWVNRFGWWWTCILGFMIIEGCRAILPLGQAGLALSRTWLLLMIYTGVAPLVLRRALRRF